MARTVTVGLDGSDESLAASQWAAREAALCGIRLRVVHVGEQQPHDYVPFGGEPIPPPGVDRSARLLIEARARLAHRHPGVQVSAEQIPGQPVPTLVALTRQAELLVLGSRGLGRVAGVLLGSVALAVVARAEGPVVLVRGVGSAGEECRPGVFDKSADATPNRDVVLGLDLRGPDDRVLAYAFAAAARRAARLRVVHGGEPAADAREGPAEVLRPWRDKFPGVEVTGEAVTGDAGAHLVDVSRHASLVVLGRRKREGVLGPHIGPVTHTVLQHAAAPVAVVPHG
ncbi:universal stress protein [Streptomyces sp. YKOK-I1]